MTTEFVEATRSTIDELRRRSYINIEPIAAEILHHAAAHLETRLYNYLTGRDQETPREQTSTVQG